MTREQVIETVLKTIRSLPRYRGDWYGAGSGYYQFLSFEPRIETTLYDGDTMVLEAQMKTEVETRRGGEPWREVEVQLNVMLPAEPDPTSDMSDNLPAAQVTELFGEFDADGPFDDWTPQNVETVVLNALSSYPDEARDTYYMSDAYYEGRAMKVADRMIREVAAGKPVQQAIEGAVMSHYFYSPPVMPHRKNRKRKTPLQEPYKGKKNQ